MPPLAPTSSLAGARAREPIGLWLLVGLAVLSFPGNASASFIDRASREINLKVVYFGTDAGQLEGNLRYVYGQLPPESKGKLIELDGADAKFLLFDFVPPALGEFRGFKLRFHLYAALPTRSAETENAETERLITKGADVIVFVADSDRRQEAWTRQKLANLHASLTAHGYSAASVPVVLQLHRSSEANPLTRDELTRAAAEATFADAPVVDADTASGAGVFDTLKAVAKAAVLALKEASNTERRSTLPPAPAEPRSSPASPGPSVPAKDAVGKP